MITSFMLVHRHPFGFLRYDILVQAVFNIFISPILLLVLCSYSTFLTLANTSPHLDKPM